MNGCRLEMKGAVRRLVPAAPNDAAGGGLDVDPDDPAPAHELQAVSTAIEFRPEIVGAAHERHDSALNHRQRHGAALAGRFERTVLIARTLGRGGAGGGNGRKEEDDGTHIVSRKP